MIQIDENYRGRGIGSEFYRYWLDKGVSIKSDKEITEGTAAIYQKLAREGYRMDIQDNRAVLLPKSKDIRFQSLTETEANAKLKQVNMAGQYGAWISPKGELFKFRTMYGHAEEIEKLVPSVKIKSPDDYNKVYDKKWVRVVNDRSNIYLTTTKPLNAEQRSTIDFMGVENEKNIILNNTQSEKIVYTHIKFQPDPASPNILNGSDGSRIIKSTSGKYRVYLATGALAGVKETLESAQKLIERKSNK
jgi:hypothetical protein